jgi:hypothetical protein
VPFAVKKTSGQEKTTQHSHAQKPGQTLPARFDDRL